MGKKNPKGRVPKPGSRVPKAVAAPVSTQGDTPHFCFHYADRASEEEWGFPPGNGDAEDVFNFLADMAQLTWREIEAQKVGTKDGYLKRHHDQPIASIATAAQDHIHKQTLDGVFGESIFRFRLGGEKRLWGFRQGRTFHVLWWDPEHEVYKA